MRFRLKRMRFSTIGAQSKLESWPMPFGYASLTSAVGYWLHRVCLLYRDWHDIDSMSKQTKGTGSISTIHCRQGRKMTVQSVTATSQEQTSFGGVLAGVGSRR